MVADPFILKHSLHRDTYLEAAAALFNMHAPLGRAATPECNNDDLRHCVTISSTRLNELHFGFSQVLSAMLKYTIRRATISDAATIAGHRVAMFGDMGQVATAELADRLLAVSTTALAELLRDGSYAGWLAVDANGDVIAGAGAHVMRQLPRISHDGRHVAAGSVPLVVNVYTQPNWRRHGVARALMSELLEWSLARGCDRVSLHASDDGRPLYASLGFVPTNEMRWTPTSSGHSEHR
jgi:GNAT superfamily N-acetyltransferase